MSDVKQYPKLIKQKSSGRKRPVKYVSFRLDSEDYENLIRYARNRQGNVSEFIREAINTLMLDDYLDICSEDKKQALWEEYNVIV